MNIETILSFIIGGVIMALFYVVIIYVHELGHWLAMRFFGFKNISLKPNIIGDLEIGRNIHHKVTLKQMLVISLSGIILGFIPLYIMKFVVSKGLLFLTAMVYWYACSGDLSAINQAMAQKDKSITIYEMNKKIWKDYDSSVKKFIESDEK